MVQMDFRKPESVRKSDENVYTIQMFADHLPFACSEDHMDARFQQDYSTYRGFPSCYEKLDPQPQVTIHTGDENPSKDHQQIPVHLRFLPFEGHDLHMSQIQQTPEKYLNNYPSMEFHRLPPFPVQIGRYFHQNIPPAPADIVNGRLLPAINSEYAINQVQKEYGCTRQDIPTEMYTECYSSSVSGYPQVANSSLEQFCELIPRQHWQHDTVVDPHYLPHQVSETNKYDTLGHSPHFSRLSTFPSTTTLPPMSLENFRKLPAPKEIHDTENQNSIIDLNKPKFQNWLISNVKPFTGSESSFYFSGTTVGNMKINPDLSLDTDSQSYIPIVSSVYSVLENYSISATHNDLKTNQNQMQLSNSNEMLISNMPCGRMRYQDNTFKPASQNVSCDTNRNVKAVDILHQHLIDKICGTSNPMKVLPATTSYESEGRRKNYDEENRGNKNKDIDDLVIAEVTPSSELSTTLLSKTTKELKLLCWKRRLKITGSKEVLVNRLLDTTEESAANDQTRMRTIHLRLKRIGATTRGLSRCLCSAIEQGFISFDIAMTDVIAKGFCPVCKNYMEATLDKVLYQPDNSLNFQSVSDLLKCSDCKTTLYVSRMCQGKPEFIEPSKHCHFMERNIFGGCAIY